MQDLSPAFAATARAIAERLARHGARAWIVGGTVRDLALARDVKDVDMASPATPAVVESEFLHTIPIGRNFGTIVVHLHDIDVEHTTFRSEEGYADGRHPDQVTFGRTPEEDAARRDFRCNALYLDPLTDLVLDPERGLDDLRAGRITCVGDPARRFAEDGLRLVRLARFAGQLDLAPSAETLAAAVASLDALRGVSRERIRVEFESLMRRGGVSAALAILHSTGIFARLLPTISADDWAWERARLCADSRAIPGIELGFALLCGPPDDSSNSLAVAESALESLRPSNAVRTRVLATWRLAAEFEARSQPARSVRIAWMQSPAFEDALELWRARRSVRGQDAAFGAQLAAEKRTLGEHGLAPAPFVTARDLIERGVAPGPRFGELLQTAARMQLDLVHATRADALRWLDGAVQERADQDGGNTRRNA